MLSTFKGNIEVAREMGEEWVETSPEIIAFFNRKGLGKAENGRPILHFDYGGIHVCEYGKTEEAKKFFNQDINQVMHGDQEGSRVEKA